MSLNSINIWFKWLQKNTLSLINSGKGVGFFAYSYARIIGWFIVTTGIVTVLPLIFEMKREAAIEELEKFQINSAIAEGKTPQELASAGLTSAIAPSVL